MKIGDLVRHMGKGWIGTILSFEENGGVLIDLSDKQGVMCRVIHFSSLQLINERR